MRFIKTPSILKTQEKNDNGRQKMVDLHSNAFWQKNHQAVREYLANQSGCSVEKAVAQAIRLK